MYLPTLADLDAAAAIVYRAMAPTPQYCWPLLDEALGAEAWVKHENHTPLGAFKVRGGLVYMDALTRRQPQLRGVLAATRGNHGQSVAFAARRHGLAAKIFVPFGNSLEKNAAMRALGAELIEYGTDFQETREHAVQVSAAKGLHMVPSWHPDLVAGVASGWLELLRAQPDLDVVFVPIGRARASARPSRRARRSGSRRRSSVSFQATRRPTSSRFAPEKASPRPSPP